VKINCAFLTLTLSRTSWTRTRSSLNLKMSTMMNHDVSANVTETPSSSTSTHVAPAQLAPSPSPSFYRRSLPDSCIGFSSRQGRSYFESAMRNRGLKSFFNLMEQHSTQSEPAYCGISTLVIVLNALAVDPRQTWKGPWRWYEESMLNCCVDLEKVKQTGITLPVFNCLAICQGLSTELHYVDDNDTDTTERSAPSSLEDFRKVVQEACIETENEGQSSDEELPVDRVLVVSYHRQALGQTGTGHFSPIAAYDQESDSVLIMDTARFKYSAHWVKLPLLFKAMQPIDPDTGRSRGYVMLIHRTEDALHPGTVHNLPISMLLRSEMKQISVRRVFKRYLASLNQEAISYQDIAQFCTKEGTSPSFVWEMTQPQLRPYANDKDTKQMIEEVRSLIQQLLFSLNASDSPLSFGDVSHCRSNHCRTIQLRPEEAILIVYLACLDDAERESIVLDSQRTASDRARRQLIAEAELVRYAIDTSDQINITGL
jgi:glutathione gamma-glutamylcysteinyltransferase